MNVHRVEAVRRKLQATNLDALLITFLPHIRYLTGFTGSNGLCLVTLKDRLFLTDRRYEAQVREDVRDWPVIVSNERLFDILRQSRKLPGKMRVGVESSHLTVTEFENLKKTFPRTTFVHTPSLVEELTRVKDEEEIETIRKAVQITDRVFTKILQTVREGMRESDVATKISYLHKKYGADADAFEPIVASGERTSFPHARATDKRIRNRDLVVIDMGCRYHGYHSDLTRTIVVGRPTAETKKMYRTVLDAQHRAIQSAKSGLKASSLDSVARNYLKKRGYGRYFVHSLGHGLGLQVHEFPRVSSKSEDMLEAGNVITIEPGIYKPEIGGVRIEDDVVIRNGHCEVLTTSPKELILL